MFTVIRKIFLSKPSDSREIEIYALNDSPEASIKITTVFFKNAIAKVIGLSMFFFLIIHLHTFFMNHQNSLVFIQNGEDSIVNTNNFYGKGKNLMSTVTKNNFLGNFSSDREVEIYDVTDKKFQKYGRVLDIDVTEFVELIQSQPSTPIGKVVYEPSVKIFEDLPIFDYFKTTVYGEMPIEFGHCSGFNNALNALEYHRSSEIDIAATDLILMLGSRQDIDYTNYTYDTDKVEIFFVPKYSVVELYATTLHYAPCGIDGAEFRCGVILPRGTNEELSSLPSSDGESKLLFAVNKWLIAHPESGIDKAWNGLKGKNLRV